jgi:hypothetical protein
MVVMRWHLRSNFHVWEKYMYESLIYDAYKCQHTSHESNAVLLNTIHGKHRSKLSCLLIHTEIYFVNLIDP